MTDHRTAGQRIRREGEPKIEPMHKPSLVDRIPTTAIALILVALLVYTLILYMTGDGGGW